MVRIPRRKVGAGLIGVNRHIAARVIFSITWVRTLRSNHTEDKEINADYETYRSTSLRKRLRASPSPSLPHAPPNTPQVAGLKEDVGLKGNEYSILLSLFTAGNVVALIPHSLILQKVRPSIWLPFTLIMWSGLTMCSAACTSYRQLCVVRFFQGTFEASLYGGTIYILGSW
jgi:hypothetical protein